MMKAVYRSARLGAIARSHTAACGSLILIPKKQHGAFLTKATESPTTWVSYEGKGKERLHHLPPVYVH
jgi:hypothetical protein